MSDQVPDFHQVPDYDYSIPVSSTRAGKSTMSEHDVMELVWHDGQLVTQRQSQLRPNSVQKRPTKYDVEHITAPAPALESQLFMHEDEMTSWLHYPLNDNDAFCSDLLYTAAKSPPPAAPRPPVHHFQARKPETAAQNFLMFSRMNNSNNNNNTLTSRFEAATAAPKSVVRETTTVVDSSDTPLVGPIPRAVDFRRDDNNDSPGISVSGDVVGGGRGGGGGLATSVTAGSSGKDGTCEMPLSLSPGGVSTSGSGSLSAELASTQKLPLPPLPVDRKRKGREPDDAKFQDEDVEFESGCAKKQKPGSSSTRRSRAAEVHNLSERRRRDRINEKMRVLQEMIPRCNKSDKASMLEEAIEYMKSLKLQLQMVSMGCGMVPTMFPGVPLYMPMGMAQMGMGMSRHMMPYGNVLPGSPMPPAAAAAHLGPRFPMPAYQMQTMPPEDPNRVQATNQSENMLHMPHTESQNQSQGPNFVDPYQQYFTPQQMQMQMQMQMQLQQQQAMAQPRSDKPSSSTAPENEDGLQ